MTLSTRSSVTTFTKRHVPHSEITAFSSAKHVASAQRQIDQEIRKSQDSIRALQSRRNSLSPVGRLPPEMLSRIFLFCSNPDSLSWIKEVSHICRHWRAVALGCPNLWSIPIFSQPRWADEMLKRSKMAPLTVKADLTYMTPKMINTLHSSLQISRIGELDVKTGSRSVPEILNLSDTAPYLHSLCLESPRYAQEHFTLPPTFLNGEAPRLRRLELTRFFMPWDSPLMNNLTHLKIQNPGPTARPSMTELVEALGRMPLLETLELDDALPRIADDVSTLSVPSARTPLPHLKRIIVANVSALECADTLNHLSYPSNTSIKISCLGGTSTVVAFSPLLQALVNVHSAGHTKHLRTLLVNIGWDNMTIRAWTSFVQNCDPLRGRAFLDLDFKWSQFMRHESQALLTFACKSLPLRGVRGLSLSTDIHEIDTKTWINTFAELPTLLTIRLRNQSAEFIAALGEDVILDGVKRIPQMTATIKPTGRRASLRRPRPESVRLGLFFPSLRNLIFQETTFEESVLDTLESTLMERCERRQELWTLTLRDCSHLSHHDVQQLRHIVPEVTWDGLVQGFSDEDSDPDLPAYDNFYSMGYFVGDDDYDSDYDYSVF
ncbi:hypothetical protein C8R43DRAFT_430595 [Mycena crocata]|nr:hypothetical protein C8R43DRAFT_430595 [Mycena crocata]